ncbi:helix-turn-helix domain-containing protein [Variovorax sp. YR216]|uniref:winged helix-turn-helix transcriptional regulator n=1 Tax=Variovorax sp. YR216 TaxID=1882828 RepID=UPI00210C0B20|nr:helix-turn-helix domain-containing protein [Variovorax sp. YR216]
MATSTTTHRSLCPINLALEVIGDRWSLLIVRDLMFAGRHHYRELLESEEGISSNILAERLGRLVQVGVLSRTDDPTHKQKAIYRLTSMGIDLLPVIAALGGWGAKYLPVTKESAAVALSLEKGGANGLKRMRASLAKAHLASVDVPSVRSKKSSRI